MKHLLKHIFIVSIILLLGGCSVTTERDLSNRNMRVVTTTGMIGDLAKNIGGDHVDVIALMGPGVDPHLYKASEGDVLRMVEADLIFYNGLHLEGKMAELFERLKDRKPVAAIGEAVPDSQRIIVAKSKESVEYDPHIWFDVSLWMRAAVVVRDKMAEVDTANAESYFRNATVYMDSLRTLHEWVVEQTKRVPENARVLITAHDAFTYFSHAYGFEVRGLQGVSTMTEAGTGDVQDLTRTIVERRIPAIFVESSVPPRTIEAVQAAVRSRGFNVRIGGELFSDAMGPPDTEEGTYLGMVRHNVTTIVHALSADGAEIDHDN